MKIIDMERGTGKSTEIVNMSEAKNVPILCPNKREKERIKELAKRHKVAIPEPITWEEYVSPFNIKKPSTVLIDEVFMFIDNILGKYNDKFQDITAVTYSKSEYIGKNG